MVSVHLLNDFCAKTIYLMSKPLVVGQELLLEDTGEKVVFVKYAELEHYVYVLEPDMGEILVHEDELKPILHQDQSDLASPIPMKAEQNQHWTLHPTKDKIELFLYRENLAHDDYNFYVYWCNGMHEGIDLRFKWCIHGEYGIEHALFLDEGATIQTGCLTKSDLSSKTHLLVQRNTDKDLLWDPVKLRFSVQRLLFGETENGWMRWELMFVQRSLQIKVGKTKVKKIVNPHVHKANYQSNTQNFINNLALPRSKDLHLESLMQEGLNPGGTPIVLFQIQEAERYLNKAFMAGMKEIYLIHGIGEGALRMRLHEMLAQHPEIEYFANEFHPRYGWGATVVRF